MKNYLVRFGASDPSNFTGLSPTFTFFASIPGGSLYASPTISEIPVMSGLYTFPYDATTFPLAFKIDGGANLSANDRFVTGILDPIQSVDQKVGASWDSYGTTAVDPSTIFGYVKRFQEIWEGPATFIKGTGLWTVYSRGVSGIALFSRVLNNLSGSVNKV